MLCILIANFLSRQANVLSISPSQYSYLYCSELFYDSTILNIYGVSCKILICFGEVGDEIFC